MQDLQCTTFAICQIVSSIYVYDVRPGSDAVLFMNQT